MREKSTILHADLDAFFAAVAQRDNPELQGKALAIGGDSPRSVVAAASYEARRFGVASAMSMVEAKRRCPNLLVVSHDWPAIEQASSRFFEILRDFSPTVEPLSLDEAFIDVEQVERLHGPPVSIAKAIRQKIKDELSLVVSVGVAPNKFVAKIASDIDKPDGLRIVDPDEVLEFIHPLPASRLWGVGKKANASLASLGLRTIGDVHSFLNPELAFRSNNPDAAKIRDARSSASANILIANKALGPGLTAHIAALCRGEDYRDVTANSPRKSIGQETTFDVDVEVRKELEPILLALCETVGSRLRSKDLKTKTVTLKIKYATFRQITRRTTFENPIDDDLDIANAAIQLLSGVAVSGKKGKDERVRLVGVSVSSFVEKGDRTQLLLIDEPKSPRVSKTLDQIREKFGQRSITRADTTKNQ